VVFSKELVDVLAEFDDEPGHCAKQEEATHRVGELTHSPHAALHCKQNNNDDGTVAESLNESTHQYFLAAWIQQKMKQAISTTMPPN